MSPSRSVVGNVAVVMGSIVASGLVLLGSAYAQSSVHGKWHGPFGEAGRLPNIISFQHPQDHVEWHGRAQQGLVYAGNYDLCALVRTLVDGDYAADAAGHSVVWDGRGDRGEPVGSGVYFYRMETKRFSATRKMVLLR
jgi:flagellar hook assembly protein FlgD